VVDERSTNEHEAAPQLPFLYNERKRCSHSKTELINCDVSSKTGVFLLQVVNHTNDVPSVVCFHRTEHCLYFPHRYQLVHWHYVHHNEFSFGTFSTKQPGLSTLLLI
jgi:hypothetical protein